MKRIKTQQTGSVILEALIAILIFSIGILALVGMQATTINNLADSKYRSTAGFLANQIIGTIWATRQNAFIANASNVMAATPDPSFACNPCDSPASGNAYTLAWAVSGVAAQLPSPSSAVIAITNVNLPPPPAINPASMVTVTISWQPPAAAAGVAPHRHVVSTIIN